MNQKIINLIARLAQRAFDNHEVPVGAVVLNSAGEVIGRGYNRTHELRDATEHAEIRAIRQAARRIGDWRLDGCTLVVNLEPCLMCLGAISHSRIREVVYFLADPAFGSVESRLTRSQLKKLFPQLIIKKVADTGETKALLQRFFQGLRRK